MLKRPFFPIAAPRFPKGKYAGDGRIFVLADELLK